MLIEGELVGEIGVVDRQNQGSASLRDMDVAVEQIIEGDQGVAGIVKRQQVRLQITEVAHHARGFIPQVRGEAVVIEDRDDRISFPDDRFENDWDRSRRGEGSGGRRGLSWGRQAGERGGRRWRVTCFGTNDRLAGKE